MNVVSDTPILGEILSSPEIVQILCELRNTAALMTDEQLFQAFADQMGKTHRKFRFFKEFQGPLDYLKQYRKNLIQEFFDAFKTVAEMRLVVPVDPTTALFQLTGASHLGSDGEKSSSASKEKAGKSKIATRRTTNKEELDNKKSHEPNSANRIVVNKIKSNSNLPKFGGPVPLPPPPQPQKPSNTSKASAGTSGAANEPKSKDRHKKEQDAVAIHETDSKQDIFSATDLIPSHMIQSNGTLKSWTLRVSKLDILKLRHELDGESVKEKMKEFEARYLGRSNSNEKVAKQKFM